MVTRVEKRIAKKAWRGYRRECSRLINVYHNKVKVASDQMEIDYYIEMKKLYTAKIKYAINQASHGYLPNGKRVFPIVYRGLKVSWFTVLINRFSAWIKSIWEIIKDIFHIILSGRKVN